MAIKECAGLDAITELIERAPKDFLVYTGEDGLAFCHQGTWRTRGYFGSQSCLRFVNHEMYQALEQGNLPEAAKIQRQLLPK